MKRKTLKCIVWDLDNTLWNGVLSEGDEVILNQKALSCIAQLDKKGVLNSISSKNNFETAMSVLDNYGVSSYFLHPQINWNAKSHSLQVIAERLNIGIDTLALIDDQLFEHAEVKQKFPEISCYFPEQIPNLLKLPEIVSIPETEESANRRKLYYEDCLRQEAEKDFAGPQEAFLNQLKLTMTITYIQPSDIERAVELTIRTNQLNTTGISYSKEEILALANDVHHRIYMINLEDIFGKYGKIGLCILHTREKRWHIKLLLISCRVMSRGVGTAMLAYLIDKSEKSGVKLSADFVSNGSNRMMYVTYRTMGFKELTEDEQVMEYQGNNNIKFPQYIIMRDYTCCLDTN